MQMRRSCQRRGFRRCKCARQQDALGMRGSESRMNTAVQFVEYLDGFPAQGQEFFVRGQGHGSVLRQRPVLNR